jgi:hypothetical protein
MVIWNRMIQRTGAPDDSDCFEHRDEADFLFLMHNTGLTRGTSRRTFPNWKCRITSHQKTFRGKLPQTLLSLTRRDKALRQPTRTSMVVANCPGAARREVESSPFWTETSG